MDTSRLFRELDARDKQTLRSMAETLGSGATLEGDRIRFSSELSSRLPQVDGARLRRLSVEILEGPLGEAFLPIEQVRNLTPGSEPWTERRLAALARQAYIDKHTGQLLVDLRNLRGEPLIALSEPQAEDLELFDVDASPLSRANKAALLKIEVAPVRMVARILRSPNDLHMLTPRQFEEFVAEALSELGFKEIILTPASRDGGKDVIASQVVNGIAVSFYFECKKYAAGHKVQLETLRSLLGVVAHDARGVNKGVLVTTSTFTAGSRQFLMQEARLDGKDYTGIMGWMDEIKKKSNRRA